MVADGCGWLRMVADGCGWLWTVANGCERLRAKKNTQGTQEKHRKTIRYAFGNKK